MKTMVKLDTKRKYVLMAMVFLLMAGTAYRFWPQIGDFFAADDTIALKKKQLFKYQKMFQTTGDLEKEVTLIKTTLKQAESGLLTGKTPALAAADIQKVIQEMAKQSQVEIRSVRVLKPEDVGGALYLSIPVQFVAAGTIRQLKEFLYQIMASSKYLTVQKVRITVRQARSRRNKGKTSRSVSADITVNGFLKS